jgi:DNA-directed RNA polymerase sigma subunit (sigma70/sigma32)
MPDRMSNKLDTIGRAVKWEQERQAAARNRDRAIRRAAEKHSLREIAGAVGLSHQRVHQIIHGR